MHLDLEKLWTAAGVLSGLQVQGFLLRINREIVIGDRGDRTWLPLADTLNLASLAVTMLGVFVAPILGISGATVALKAFGLSALLLVSYPFALAGHYEMFNRKKDRTQPVPYCPGQERIVLSIAAVAAVTYIVLASAR